MGSEAQKRATARYRSENVKQVIVRFYPKDRDVYEHLKLQPRISEYIIGLIKRDMRE